MSTFDEAILEGAALLDLDPLETVLEVGGTDGEEFLQRMVSCDLRKATANDDGGHAVLGTVMTGKGKLIAPFRLLRVRDGDGARFWFVVERSARDPLREALERLVILEDVTFTDPELRIVSVQGPGADGCLQGESVGGDPLPAHDGDWVTLALGDDAVGRVMRRTRSTVGGWDLILPAAKSAGVCEGIVGAGAIAVDADAIERHRILAGLPRFGIDATDANLPPEVGLDAAIAYDKGCYAGQEVVARIRTYGHVNRRLCLCRTEGDPPAVATELFAPDAEENAKPIGSVTSSTAAPGGGAACLASVRYKRAEAGAELRTGGDGTIRVERVLGFSE